MNTNLIIIITGIVLALILFSIGIIVIFIRKRKNKAYIIEQNDAYRIQVYKTFVKYIPYSFILCGILCLIVVVKFLTNSV